ncbi:insulinase family protein [Halomonas sp. LR3S48]|uniref:insulinase family protein n=1 Tax=Halomonas sp. LR3S48 TaxID=2982694 RepID=UPI0021E429C3|nr:insulinase family protein [Halomonas sp. LR3S48]UYG03317.1 insulinase family protein [Halomonas sp. LR3S48]
MNAPTTAPNDDETARRAGLPPGSRLHEIRLASGLTIAAAEVPGARLQRLVGAVGVGYLDEPGDCRGLAHLLEHAMFLGSANFPDSSELACWVGERGGRYNARTEETVTDIHLHLPPGDADEGLARLVDMLAQPRFELERIAQEVKVLDAEFQARLADPALHRRAALGRLCREGHPARLCHAGNRNTLGDDTPRLVAQLRDFHRLHYGAERMVLVMLGPLPLEEQLELLARRGAALPAREARAPIRNWRWSEPGGVAWHPPTAKAGTKSRTTTLELFWPLPEEQASAHADWLASVAARLADGRLAATLQAAIELEQLEVTLAPDGMGNALALCLSPAPDREAVQAMVSACHSALERALAAPLPTPPAAPLDLDAWPRRRATELVANRQDTPQPAGGTTEALLPWLAPEQCRLLWQSPLTPHRWATLAETGTAWHALPLPGESIPLPWRAPPALTVRPTHPRAGDPTPRQLHRNEQFTLWTGDPILLPDAPPASLCLGWPAPASQQAARLAQWRQNTLPLRQAAASHGMRLSCAGDARGDWLIATGTTERLEALVELAVACWPEKTAPASTGPAEGLLAQRMLARLEALSAPVAHDAGAGDLLGWASGCANERAAEALIRHLAERLAEAPAPVDEPRHEAQEDTHWLPPQGSDHAAMLELLGPDDTPRSRWLLRLLAQCHDAAFHHEMRQRRGLGYVAAVRYREASGFPRLGYVIQSPGTEAGALRQAILDFLSRQGEALAKLSPAEMIQRRHGLLSHAGRPETHAEATARLWQALRRQAAAGSDTSPWQPLPWEAEEQALAALHCDDLLCLAKDLAMDRLAMRWWLHRPSGADA